MVANFEILHLPPQELRETILPGDITVTEYSPATKIPNSPEIYERVGVREVARAGDETAYDMLLKVGKRSFDRQKARGLGSGLGLLAVATSYPTGENLSGRLARETGIKPAFNFDIHTACSGFGRFLVTLDRLQQNNDLSGIPMAFAASEKYSDFLNHESLDDAIFTDGAVMLSGLVYGKNFRVISAQDRRFFPPTDPNQEFSAQDRLLCMPINPELMVAPYIAEAVPPAVSGEFEMDGPAMFKSLINSVRDLTNDILTTSGFEPEQIDAVIFHQGSGRTNYGLKTRLPLLKDKIIEDVEDGNLSSGSIPKAMRLLQQSGKERMVVLTVGFGAGLYGAGGVIELGNLDNTVSYPHVAV